MSKCSGFYFMKFLLKLILILQISSCFFSESNRLYIKEVSCKGCKIEWFCYSYIGNFSRDYITINCKGKEDIICESTNVKDIYADQCVLYILFYGSPKCYNKKIKINNVIETKIDTDNVISEP